MRSMRFRNSFFVAVLMSILLAFLQLFVVAKPQSVYAGSNNCADELFFSEYIEGSSNNKALEIYNGTGTAVDLGAGDYEIRMHFGSSSTVLTLDLTGTVLDSDVFVAAHSSADPLILAQADFTNGAGWFNGDDAIVLTKGGTVIDVIGQVGFDPGSEWSGGGIGTQNETLRRKGFVLAGDTNEGDGFDPSVEWNGFAIDTFDGLGSHATVCTNNTITLDGTFNQDEWGNGLGVVNNVQYGITWDANSWYFAINDTTGTGFSDTDYFMIGIDIDPLDETDATNSGGGFGDGTSGEFCGATFPDENKPDYIARVRQTPYAIDSFFWNGANWTNAAWSEGSAGNFDMSGNGDTYEVRIDLAAETAFDSNNPVAFYLWQANSSCEYFNVWPPENDNAYRAGSNIPGNGIFIFAANRFMTTDNGRLPANYALRVGWDTDNTIGVVGTHTFFGDDDVLNPWLQFDTAAEDDGNCTVNAKMVANNAFAQGTGNFVGVNRYIDFTLTNCTGLDATLQMRYETEELNGTTEDNTLKFFRCSGTPCSSNWSLVEPGGSVYVHDAINNNLSVSNVSETNFSAWTIANEGLVPTAVSLTTFTANPTTPIILILFTLFIVVTGWLCQRRQA